MTDSRHLLLFGSRGFVGSHLKAIAEAAGHRVSGTSRDGVGADLACDLLEDASVRRSIRATAPDLIINAAGSGSVRAAWVDPAGAMTVHATAVQRLLRAVADEAPTAHVLCLSSAQVYGDPEPSDLPLEEGRALSPVSPYAEAKAAMESVCADAAASLGLNIGVARLFNQIGPGQPEAALLSDVISQVMRAEASRETEVRALIGNPGAERDYVDVRDGARACLAISEQRLIGPFNVCSGRGLSVAGLVNAVDALVTQRVVAQVDPTLTRPNDSAAIVGDGAKLAEATGWKPTIALEQTIKDLLVERRTERT